MDVKKDFERVSQVRDGRGRMAHADLGVPFCHEPPAPPGTHPLFVVLGDGALPGRHLKDHVVIVPDLVRDMEDLAGSRL